MHPAIQFTSCSHKEFCTVWEWMCLRSGSVATVLEAYCVRFRRWICRMQRSRPGVMTLSLPDLGRSRFCHSKSHPQPREDAPVHTKMPGNHSCRLVRLQSSDCKCSGSPLSSVPSFMLFFLFKNPAETRSISLAIESLYAQSCCPFQTDHLNGPFQ